MPGAEIEVQLEPPSQDNGDVQDSHFCEEPPGEDPSEVSYPKNVMATTPILSPDVVGDGGGGSFEERPWELRRECTVPKVKEEAEKVLDVFLKRSLSMNDASPRRRYMIKVRKEVGRGKTISKYSDIAEETDLTHIGRSSFRKSVEHSVINDIEDDVEPKSSSAPGSLHYRVQLKPTEETLKKLDQIQARLDSQSPETPSKKKKHSFSSFARSIHHFLKSPTKSKKLSSEFKDADKKEKEKEKEKEHKKSGIRASFRKKFSKKEKRKVSKEQERGSQDSILTPSSATSGAITPSSLSSNDILEADSSSKKKKKHKKRRGYEDVTTPDSAAVSPDMYANGDVGGYGSGRGATAYIDEIGTDEDHRDIHLVSSDGRHKYRCQVYRTQRDNKRESKESEKIKDYADEFPLIYEGGGDDTDGPGASRLRDGDRAGRGGPPPPRPTSLDLPSSIRVVPDRLQRPVTAIGLNGITEALEVELDSIRHASSGDSLQFTRVPGSALATDVEVDAGDGFEDISSEEEYKPFKDRTEKEKEKLYEKIAARLADIGDRVVMDHTLGESLDDFGAVGGQSSPEKKKIEIEEIDGNLEKEQEEVNFTETDARILGLRLREHGDRRSSSEVFSVPLSILMTIVRNTAYDSFKDVAQTVIGEDTSWKQLALVLKITKDAMRVAGSAPNVARQIKDNTLRFIGDRFAEWISSQGGWSSCMDEILTESESEVD